MNTTTPDRLARIARPFIGTGRSIHRGNSAIDVLATAYHIDTSVIAVDASGLVLNSGDFRVILPWAEVRAIRVRGICDGDETGEGEIYLNAAAKWPVSDAALVRLCAGYRAFERKVAA
jgi:hypothetical protein